MERQVSMIYHISHDDLDGVSCAVILSRIVGHKDYKPVFCGHLSIDKEVEKYRAKTGPGDLLFITDIAPSEALIKKMFDDGICFYVMDHHRTNLYMRKYEGVSNIFTDACATLITANTLTKTNQFNYQLSDLEKEFMQAVNAWDMWETKSKYRKRGENLNSLFNFFGIKKFYKYFSENVNTDLKDPFCIQLITFLEESRDKYVRDTVSNQIKNEIKIDNFGNTFKMIIATQYISDIGNEALLRTECEGVAYVAVVCPHNNSISLRSNTIDVGEIAKRFGGGGHRNASGFHRDFKKLVGNFTYKILTGNDDPSL
jgi:oligoribonuclease NrnB/cAMP/cGMP phosphodiesterase (DHH superfamily)